MKVYAYWVPCVRNSFNSFMPIILKLYSLRLQVFLSWSENVHVVRILIFITFSAFELSHFSAINTITLYAQLLLQFYANLFQTLQVFLPWSEDMHMAEIKSSGHFFLLTVDIAKISYKAGDINSLLVALIFDISKMCKPTLHVYIKPARDLSCDILWPGVKA